MLPNRNRISTFAFMEAQVEAKRSVKRIGTSVTYENLLRSFRKFRNNQDILLKDLDVEIIELYESWLKSQGVRRNTSSCYLRSFRSIYNRAVRKELIAERPIFRQVFTGYAHTIKRAISADSMKAIAALQLPEGSSLAWARDLFMLCFLMRGISFVDLAYLKKTDLPQGEIIYCRHKTRQEVHVQWTEQMQMILNRYALQAKDTPYLLPIILRADGTEHRQYLSAMKKCNRLLKQVAVKAGVETALTTYVARHTWATLAQQMNIPISVISKGMGHDSIRTTQIYLASIDTQIIDEANRAIIERVLSDE